MTSDIINIQEEIDRVSALRDRLDRCQQGCDQLDEIIEKNTVENVRPNEARHELRQIKSYFSIAQHNYITLLSELLFLESIKPDSLKEIENVDQLENNYNVLTDKFERYTSEIAESGKKIKSSLDTLIASRKEWPKESEETKALLNRMHTIFEELKHMKIVSTVSASQLIEEKKNILQRGTEEIAQLTTLAQKLEEEKTELEWSIEDLEEEIEDLEKRLALKEPKKKRRRISPQSKNAMRLDLQKQVQKMHSMLGVKKFEFKPDIVHIFFAEPFDTVLHIQHNESVITDVTMSGTVVDIDDIIDLAKEEDWKRGVLTLLAETLEKLKSERNE